METIQGQLSTITFRAEDTGFTVARFKEDETDETITIVGNLATSTPGEVLKLTGEWANHSKFGRQFKIQSYETGTPVTVEGIENYLGSGLIKGIGPSKAKRIVEAFGIEALEIIEKSPTRLNEISGFGKKTVQIITEAWEQQKEVQQVMLFLQSHGVSSGYATKIYKQYENESIAIVKENPYRLADDIFGIGFQVADAIAGKLGFSKDSSLRIESGILYVLKNLSNNGNVFYPESLLLRESLSVLGIQNNEILNDALESLKKNKKVIIEEINEREKAVYLSSFFYAERTIAHKIKDLLNEPTEEKKAGTKESIEWVQKELSINLAENQVTAVERALQSKVMIITGGPGTGKTTIINSILKIFSKENINIMLAAPTGRAAKRMSEATGYEAKTIHRLLEYNPRQGGFQINEDNLLDCDLLIVDEASMIDTLLMNSLLKGMPVQTTFILVGDVNQLPSVGAGNVLKDVIESGAIPVVELNEIFRQAKESNIIVNAHKINHGELPDLTVKENTDFYFINKNESGTIANTIIQLVQSNIPAKFNYNAVDDIQVLTPMHKGDIGTMVLNERLQEALNPGKTALKRGDKSFRVKDKVMQIKNNYDKEVYNGDIGRISSVDAEEQLVVINFDGKFVEYDYGELDEIVLAYAVTVHKSQGSEYPVIVMPLHAQQYVMLQRNLVYTGITRGKELVILVGTKHALSAAVKNNESRKRYTRLAYRLGKRVE